LQEVFK
jgi:hypothetical protein